MLFQPSLVGENRIYGKFAWIDFVILGKLLIIRGQVIDDVKTVFLRLDEIEVLECCREYSEA